MFLVSCLGSAIFVGSAICGTATLITDSRDKQNAISHIEGQTTDDN
jgi:hypothetical protein